MFHINMFKNLKVRTSLVLVLTFFVLSLIVGAATGLYSLRANSQTFEQVVRSQVLRVALNDSIDHFRSVQVSMSQGIEALLRYRVDQQAEALDAGGYPVPIIISGEPARVFIQQAKRDFAASREAYEHFETLSVGEKDRVYNSVSNAYQSLMNGGVEPLFDFLEAGDVEGYNAFKDGTGEYMQADLYHAVARFNRFQQDEVARIQAEEQAHFLMVVQLVAVGLTASLIISLLAYLFLGRVVLRPLRLASDHFDRIAAGDLTQRIEVRAHNEIGLLFDALRRMQDGLTRTVTSVRQGVEEISLGSNEIFMGNTDLSSRTEQQAASLQETAASMEELAGTVKQNTDNATRADQLAKEASKVVQRGGVAVSQVVNTMDHITTSSGKIADIVSVIDGIAFQTNILALNASVEAARAGEQGKGFAVVAGEVRSLAQRSAQAAKEIKTLIEDSLETVQSGSAQADQAGAIMQEVVASINHVTTIMGEIAVASNEQLDGIEQVNQAVAQMDGVVQQNAALVEQAAAAAGSLQQQAGNLTEAVSVFKLSGAEIIDVPLPDESEPARLQQHEPDEPDMFERHLLVPQG